MWLRVLLAVLIVFCVGQVSGGVACWAVELLVLKSNRYCCKLTLASLAIPTQKVLILRYLGAVTIMCHRVNLRLLAIVKIPIICR